MNAIEVRAEQGGALAKLVSALRLSALSTVLVSQAAPAELLERIIYASPQFGHSQSRNGLLQFASDQVTCFWGVFASGAGSIALMVLSNEANDTQRLTRVMMDHINKPFRSAPAGAFAVAYAHFGDTPDDTAVAAVAVASDTDQEALWAARGERA